MEKKVLIISSSPRKNSNSEAIAEQFAAGARSAGHTAEIVSLRGKDIRFCQGCFACQSSGRCFQRDDADAFCQKMEQADVLVFATPIYYYEMSGQLKTMLDRGNPLFVSDYRFREVCFLASAAEDEEGVDERAYRGVCGWVECFPKARMAGRVFAGGVTASGEIGGHKALQEAFALGASL